MARTSLFSSLLRCHCNAVTPEMCCFAVNAVTLLVVGFGLEAGLVEGATVWDGLKE